MFGGTIDSFKKNKTMRMLSGSPESLGGLENQVYGHPARHNAQTHQRVGLMRIYCQYWQAACNTHIFRCSCMLHLASPTLPSKTINIDSSSTPCRESWSELY